MALSDTQLVQLLGERLPDNTSEEITPDDLRDVLLELVRAKVNLAQLQGYAPLASPTFNGVPQVPTAAAGTATNQVASTGFVAQALAMLAGSRNLSELVLPQAVIAGNWYLTLGGIWEPRRSFTAQADPVSGANWRQVASFTGPAVTITADAILDATPAGKRIITAASAAAQRALLGNPSIAVNQYGTHPGFTAEDGPDGLFAWVIKSLLAVQAVNQPDAPTNGRVNDVSKEFSFKLNPAYPSYLQYLSAGLPGSTGAVALSPANAYQIGDTAYLKVGSAVLKGNLAVYVAGSGNVPAGRVLVNEEAFTGAASIQPAAVKATKPRFGAIDDNNNVVTLNSDYATDQVRWGVEGKAEQTLGSNSICSPGNIAGRLYAYVVADAAANRSVSETVYSEPFSVNATANNAPTVALSSPQAGKTLGVGDPVVLNAYPQDADGASDIKRVDYYDNGVKFTETNVAPHTVQRNLSAGAHSFTARVYDMVGASGLSSAIQVTAQTPVQGGKSITVALYVGQSNDSGLSPLSDLPSKYLATDSRVKGWDYTTKTAYPYSHGQLNPNTGAPYSMQDAIAAGNISLGDNTHGISKLIVPSYDNGVGPSDGFVDAWKSDAQNAGKELIVHKTDLTPPVSTDGSSIIAWLDGIGGRPPLYTGFYQSWQAMIAYLTAQGYSDITVIWICGIGEQDSSDYNNAGGGTNPDFKAAMIRYYNRFITDGVITASSKVIIAQKQRPGGIDATIAAAQAAFVNAYPGVAKLAVLPSPAFLSRDNTHYQTESILRLGALEYSLFNGSTGGGGTGAETSISTGTWVDENYLVQPGTTLSAGIYSTTGTSNDWGKGGTENTKYRASGTEARARMKYTDTSGINAALGLTPSASYPSGAQDALNAMQYMFFISSGGVVAIHYYGQAVSSNNPAVAGHYYCLKVSAADRVTVEESIDGTNWVVLFVYPTAASGALYNQFDLFNNFAHLQYPQTLNFVPVSGGGNTNTSSGTWDIAAIDAVSSDTTYSNGTASTTGSGGFGHTGVNTLTTRQANAEARLGFRYTSATNQNGALGLSEQLTLQPITALRYSFYVGADGNLNAYYQGNGVNTGYKAVMGLYYALHITPAGKVSIEESSDRIHWTERYPFSVGYNGALAGHFDLFTGSSITEMQSQGLGTYSGTPAGANSPGSGAVGFTSAADVQYNSATDTYTTNSTDGNWGHTVMGTQKLAAGQTGFILLNFDGAHGLAVLGLHTSPNPFPSFNIAYGMYLEPKPGGGFGMRSINDKAASQSFQIDPAVSGYKYGLFRDQNMGIDLVCHDGTQLQYIGNIGTYADDLWPGLSLLGDPTAAAVAIRTSW